MQTQHVLAKAQIGLLAVPATRTTTGNGSGLDVGEYEGTGVVVLDSTASGGTGTMDLTLEESDTSGGTYTAVPAAAYAEAAEFAQVTNAATSLQIRHLNLSDRKQFIRAKWTIGGGSPSLVFGVHLLAQKKYS